MVEVALEHELLETHVLGDHRVDVESVEQDQNDQKDGEDYVVGLSENGDHVGLPHDADKRGVLIVDDLQEVVSQRS